MRVISNRFRLVFTGISHSASDLAAEYRIEDSDDPELSEGGKRLTMKDVDFTSTLEEIWSSSVKNVKEEENI